MGFETYEMFAHGFFSEAIAIGRVTAPRPGFPINSYYDLWALADIRDSRIDHSGQFNNANVRIQAYWKTVMQEAHFI